MIWFIRFHHKMGIRVSLSISWAHPNIFPQPKDLYFTLIAVPPAHLLLSYPSLFLKLSLECCTIDFSHHHPTDNIRMEAFLVAARRHMNKLCAVGNLHDRFKHPITHT